MRYSNAFIPTLKEAPKDAITPSHILLLRAGYVRMIGSGIYEMLPLGHRVLSKVTQIVREEMNRSDAQEILMPAILPADYFKESGRWETFGPTLLRLQDRKGGDYHLGPTHEEIITDMVRRDVRSYRQLPLNLYQIQMKYRDEPRPRAGLLRCREFLMKDAYSFDVDEESAQNSYDKMRDTYRRIFDRLGLDYRIVAADSGAMGGSTSAEFQVLTQTGEDGIVACSACEYAANTEVAETTLSEDAGTSDETPQEIGKIHTPGVGGIDDVVNFIGDGLTASRMLKSLVYVAGEELVMVVVRGDHAVNEIKLARYLGVSEVHLAGEEQVKNATGAPTGFAGPVGYEGRVVADHDVSRMVNAVTGANEGDYHLQGVCYGRDFKAEIAGVREVVEGDACPKCGEGLKSYRGIEGGHIFILGTHYSAKMGATFLDSDGKEQPIVMGCYGIGVSRLMAAAIEQNHDENGIRWPMTIAPYQVMITPLGNDEAVVATATDICTRLREANVEVILDDRKERPGVKFKDADLLGIPLRVTVGGRGLKEGVIELKARSAEDAEKVAIEDCVSRVIRDVQTALEATKS